MITRMTKYSPRMLGEKLVISWQVQAGLDPDQWKPFNDVGAGAKEIIIDLDDGWFRIMYVANFSEAVYVLHSF